MRLCRDEILCSRTIDMDQHSIKNVKNSADRLDAVNKAYADRIKYKTASGNIHNTILTNHILFTFPTAKAFASEKIKIYMRCGLNDWYMSGLQHQVQYSQLSGLAFTKFLEVRPL